MLSKVGAFQMWNTFVKLIIGILSFTLILQSQIIKFPNNELSSNKRIQGFLNDITSKCLNKFGI